MESISTIINRIQFASPYELGRVLEGINKDAFQNNDWDVDKVKESYTVIVTGIGDSLDQCMRYLEAGEETMRVQDVEDDVLRVLDVRKAIPKLQRAKSFFENPPVVENPNPRGMSVRVDAIDWSKPVYTADEVKTLLGLSDATFRRWVNGGWISYTQMDGSDKKFIQKEHLLAFLNNEKIFYPSSK